METYNLTVKRDVASSKSILAKLLATENINVEHKNVSTAYFDLGTRTLVCPVWKDMDGALYDLIMGHEVGHALETPKEGWHSAIKNSQSKFKSYLNVLEDARIEKKVKRRYPGLARSFAAAYKELYNRDFFGIKQLPSIDDLTLIDRLNIRFKIGAHVHVRFSAEEEAFVKETENLETWEQVVALAQRVFEYTKDNEQSKVKNLSELQDLLEAAEESLADEMSEDFGDDSEDSDESDEMDFDADSEDASEGDGEGEESDDSGESEKPEAKKDDSGSEEQESVTDRFFRQREQELVGGTNIDIMDLPTPVLENIVIPCEKIVSRFEEWLNTSNTMDWYKRHGVSLETVKRNATNCFNKQHKKYIANLVQEFQRQKKASEYNRQQTARTGVLDMNKIHNYKYSSDLFKKVTVTKSGKNHGMVLFLDMSASMTNIFADTIDQLLIFIEFCQKTNIPFEVYGYGNYTRFIQVTSKKWNWNPNATCFAVPNDSIFELLHLCGSSLSKNLYKRSVQMLQIIAQEYMYGRRSKQSGNYYDRNGLINWNACPIYLGNTPMISTVIASRALVDQFRNNNKVDVVNVMYLTDGDPTDRLWKSSVPEETGKYITSIGDSDYIRDPISKKKCALACALAWRDERRIDSIMALMSDVMDCNVVGIFLAESKRAVRRFLDRAGMGLQEISAFQENWRKNKFANVEMDGYNKFFCVAVGDIDTEAQLPDGATRAALRAAFKNMQKSKVNNRVLSNQIIGAIAS